jgi:hypothetical protein
LFLISITLAGKETVHFLPFHVKAEANLVQVLEDLVPQEEIDGRDQHGNVAEREVVHNRLYSWVNAHKVRHSNKAVDRSFLIGLQVRVKFLGNLEAEFEGLDVALGDGCIRNVEVLSQ